MRDMIKRSESILILILCAVLAITGITFFGFDTAYAAEKTPFTITFKGKSVKLDKDFNNSIENGIKKISYKSLKKKWGKASEATDYEGSPFFWIKDTSSVIYYEGETKNSGSALQFELYSKNSGICGIKIGAKKAAVLKKLKKIVDQKYIYREDTDYVMVGCEDKKGNYTGMVNIVFGFSEGKLISICGVANDIGFLK